MRQVSCELSYIRILYYYTILLLSLRPDFSSQTKVLDPDLGHSETQSDPRIGKCSDIASRQAVYGIIALCNALQKVRCQMNRRDAICISL